MGNNSLTGESVLLGRKGTIDKPLYINGSFWVVDTMFYTVVNNKAVPKYLYYCTLTIRFDLYSTSTAVPSMTQNDLGSIYFAIPDMAEQQTIAAFLNREN
jgi:type I restriction enzyme, S subunit